MGLVAGPTTTNATLVATRVTADLRPGTLKTATVVCLEATVGKGEIAVLLTVERGGPGDSYAIATLIDDYVYTGHNPAWSGEIHCDTGDTLVLTYRSSVAARLATNSSIIRRGA